jgi:hypothetical protein
VGSGRTPIEYAFWPSPENAEYGLLLCEDEDGKRWTLRGDPEFVKMMLELPPEARQDLEIGGEWEELEGWPDEWQVPGF